jgi:hypothetical protein
MLAMPEGHSDESRAAGDAMISATESLLLAEGCLDVAPTALPRFLPLAPIRDFDDGRLARRLPPMASPRGRDPFRSRGSAAAVSLAMASGAGSMSGAPSALVQRTSEAAIIGKMSTY